MRDRYGSWGPRGQSLFGCLVDRTRAHRTYPMVTGSHTPDVAEQPESGEVQAGDADDDNAAIKVG